MFERGGRIAALGARSRAALIGLQVVTGLLLAAYVASTILRAPGTSSVLFDTWIGNLAYAGSALLCGWRALAKRRDRWAWSSLALSLSFFTAGSVLWTSTVQFWNPVPYPSPADACFLVFYPIAYIGLGLLIRAHLPKGRAAWSDGLIAGLGITAIGASLVLGPISRASQGNTAAVLTNIAYPIGDLLLIAMLVGFLAVRGRRPGSLWWYLAVGFVLFAGADSVYVWRVASGTYATGTPLDALWAVAAFGIALGAWHGRPGPVRTGPPGQPILVPVLFMTSSLAIVALANVYNLLPVAVALASATLVVAVIRMIVGYRQLRDLADIRLQARTDELTGLENRRGFYDTLQRALKVATNYHGLAVLMVDLDRFKEINDCLGHRVGDVVLSQLGPRLTQAVGPGITVARLGGDEFALLVPGADTAGAVAVAAQVTAALVPQVKIDGMSLRVEASIGIALGPDHGNDADMLLQHADIAMYEAKRDHLGWAVYSTDRDFHSRDSLELAGALPGAIAGGQLILLYQSKLDLASRRVVGVEALARWQHPTRGLLTPDYFIDLAERTGQMGALTDAVLDAAVRQQAAWRRAGLHLSMAVNLSASNLLDQSLSSRLAQLLQAHAVPAATLVLEITEGALMSDPEEAQRLLRRLRLLGCDLSIDDYGTGFSSLAYLRNLPVNELKLDGSFLVDATTDARARSIVRSTVDLAHSLGLRMVAEGVETAETLELLTAMGCDQAQGYFISRPVPAGEVAAAFDRERTIEQLAQPVG